MLVDAGLLHESVGGAEPVFGCVEVVVEGFVGSFDYLLYV